MELCKIYLHLSFFFCIFVSEMDFIPPQVDLSSVKKRV